MSGTTLAHSIVIDSRAAGRKCGKEQNMSGAADKAKGRVKEAIGALTGDRKMKREGKIDQADGDVKDSAEKTVDRVKNALNR